MFVESVLDEVYKDYSKRLKLRFNVTDEWNALAEGLFTMMDEDKKGHIEAEAVQFWAAMILIPEVKTLEPILLRKQTGDFLQEMRHTNGLVTMRGWKNYLIEKNWKTEPSLKSLEERFNKTIETWSNIRTNVFNSESLANYSYLNSTKHDLPSIWNQCILNCVTGFSKEDKDKLYKFLRFVGIQLGSTPSLSTKGSVCIQGTHMKQIPELSLFIMANFLQLSGQHHTTASVYSFSQDSLDALSGDSRFKAIRKTLQTYDSLLNIVLYELIANSQTASSPAPYKLGARLQYSSTSSILTKKIRSITPTASMKQVQSLGHTKAFTKSSRYYNKNLENKVLSPKPQRTHSTIKISPNKSLCNSTVIKATLQKTSTSPIRGKKETYEEVMKRLNNK